MSIRMRNVYMRGSQTDAVRPLFEGLEMEIREGARVGVLGAPKSGKSTLLRLMCGTAVPEGGRIERSARISWPIPLWSFFSVNATVAQNVRFVADLYGVTDSDFCRRITGPFGLGDYLAMPLHACPKFVQPRLALALGVGIDFDTYLFDGSFSGADKGFKEEAAELVGARMADRGYVVATAVPTEAQNACDSVYVLEAGRARYFADAAEGITHFKKSLAAEKAKPSARQQKRQSDEDGEADALGDIDMISAAVADAVD